MTLDELSLKHGTDKGSSTHFYTRHYEKIFGEIRLNVESVVEVGVGDGASLRMWREWFPNAVIQGVDMNGYEGMGERIQLHAIEQTDCVKLTAYLTDKYPEIVIDDASHDEEKTFKTLDCLWELLRTGGWYVIEDMNTVSFPPKIGQWYGYHAHQIRKLYILTNHNRGSLITFIQKA